MASAICLGLRPGIDSIAQHSLPLYLLGSAGYGAILGKMAPARLAVGAAAPFVFAAAMENSGLSGILCGGPVSSVEEPLAKDDGELCLCLDPFPRRPFPLLGRVVKNEI